MGDEMERDRRPAMERHIQTVIAAILVGLVGWIGITITDATEAQARLEVKVENMQDDLDKLVAKIDDGILPQTRLELGRIDQRIDNLEEYQNTIWPRLREMKERIQALEPEGAGRWQY